MSISVEASAKFVEPRCWMTSFREVMVDSYISNAEPNCERARSRRERSESNETSVCDKYVGRVSIILEIFSGSK